MALNWDLSKDRHIQNSSQYLVAMLQVQIRHQVAVVRKFPNILIVSLITPTFFTASYFCLFFFAVVLNNQKSPLL
jgi:hypothetical protein